MDLGFSFENVINAFTAFHKATYRAFSDDYQKLRMVAEPKDLDENDEYFFNLPDEYNSEFVNMIAYGYTIKEAFELLKDTYKF